MPEIRRTKDVSSDQTFNCWSIASKIASVHSSQSGCPTSICLLMKSKRKALIFIFWDKWWCSAPWADSSPVGALGDECQYCWVSSLLSRCRRCVLLRCITTNVFGSSVRPTMNNRFLTCLSSYSSFSFPSFPSSPYFLSQQGLKSCIRMAGKTKPLRTRTSEDSKAANGQKLWPTLGRLTWSHCDPPQQQQHHWRLSNETSSLTWG